VAPVLTPATLMKIVERVLASEGLAEPDRVWTVHGSWEVPLAQQLRHQFPKIPFDTDVERESNGLVFTVDMKSLRAIGAQVESLEAGKLKLLPP